MSTLPSTASGSTAALACSGVSPHALALPLQVHIVHEGGQLYDAGPVRDSVAVASGIVLSKTAQPAEPALAGGKRPGGADDRDPRAAGAVVASMCPTGSSRRGRETAPHSSAGPQWNGRRGGPTC